MAVECKKIGLAKMDEICDSITKRNGVSSAKVMQ
jgi:hypothetical protein